MIKINKDEVHIEGDIREITTEIVLALKDLSAVMNSNGLDNEVLLGALFTGLYNIEGEKGHIGCYKLGKFIDYKCKELKNREN